MFFLSLKLSRRALCGRHVGLAVMSVRPNGRRLGIIDKL